MRISENMRVCVKTVVGLKRVQNEDSYPVWIYDVTRAKIGYDQKWARELKNQYA